ncbi:MAG: hypothetical protein LUI60_02060 [Clostridia bacterium]|nr:hypothetical protein [Clostridia bacterium]
MRKLIKNNLHRLIALAVVIIIMVAVVLGGSQSAAIAYAASYVGENEYDSTSILDDLDGATINGETFDITNYAYTTKQDTQVLTFTEYCYSYYENQRGNYSLYVYVWNPQGLDIVYNSTLNYISIRFGDDTRANYSKYRLYYCSQTTGGYQGLIYKFKVYLDSDDKEEIFDTLNSLARVYSVSEIELKTEGNSKATSYYVSTKYTYSGFAAGYGNNNTTSSTLSITAEQEDTLTLNNVGTAYYRPDGNNGTDDYTQDSLQSVYFAVPNSYIEKYGYLVGLSAEWYEAVLYPMLVTSSSDAYNNLNSYLGKDVSSICETDDNFQYGFAVKTDDLTWGNIYNTFSYVYGLPFDDGSLYSDSSGLISSDLKTSNSSYYLSTLYSMFLNEDYDGESNTEVVSSSEIINALYEATEAAYSSYSFVADTYASYLFESYDTEATEFSIDMRDENNTTVPLTSQTVSYDNWWKKLWGNETVTSTKFDNIPVLEEVTAEDFSSSYTDSVNAANLYVSEADYADLKDYYNKWVNKATYTAADGTVSKTDGYTIYICRYDVSNYVSGDATLFSKNSNILSGSIGWCIEDASNYFFQETVYLNFDIIDVTFTNGEKDTVLGVVMSPIDVASASTSPINPGDGDSSCDGVDWKLILGIVLVVVLLLILAPILPYIVRFIVWIISLPFKAIAAIIKALKKPKDKNKTNENKRE